MATYVYETIPSKPGEKPKTFEIQQKMTDEPLVKHPETGELVRRVITGGLGTITSKGKEGDGSRRERTLQCSCRGNCE
ncbi:MAG TPA: zinc ribbon domain-containing protein [Candidatus Latescibacteria bacterium]|nr:zinc ribbon domain-containing protein [Candidatus Latescibacterota bacterium]